MSDMSINQEIGRIRSKVAMELPITLTEAHELLAEVDRLTVGLQAATMVLQAMPMPEPVAEPEPVEAPVAKVRRKREASR